MNGNIIKLKNCNCMNCRLIRLEEKVDNIVILLDKIKGNFH